MTWPESSRPPRHGQGNNYRTLPVHGPFCAGCGGINAADFSRTAGIWRDLLAWKEKMRRRGKNYCHEFMGHGWKRRGLNRQGAKVAKERRAVGMMVNSDGGRWAVWRIPYPRSSIRNVQAGIFKGMEQRSWGRGRRENVRVWDGGWSFSRHVRRAGCGSRVLSRAGPGWR